ncbi:Eukaryotic translation initiation factor 5A [Hondaea fermentalgiana]|uniref:Eukaryotic translation initiation factor 5A n=1 Tax=Hondaea fermentalgiana TaxID=2315210 RepID=A0A2R5GE81_9STRA|nr:Eukaryotic translation initiation factor 5A [Hondaea fermentalgiana]|eukprot:GBG29247.1 Eukaryotic translation initiation factor 5A [Hondaea fermentalgiana]
MTEVETFESAGEVAEKTYPIRAGEVKKGMIVMLKGFPCKVIEVTTSKTGKHGHAKANITGLDIFTGAKKVDISPTSHNMTAPFVTVSSYTLLDVSEDGFCSLMDEAGETREDLKCPDSNSPDSELGDKIRAALEAGKDVSVTVTKAMDSEVITDYKEQDAA